MNRVGLFAVACILGGIGGLGGSIVGHSFGKAGIWAGGILGGLLASLLTARIAVWRRWIVQSQFWRTAFGATVGFLLACIVVVNTLNSPVGPIVSTLLIGAGAVIGSMRGQSGTE